MASAGTAHLLAVSRIEVSSYAARMNRLIGDLVDVAVIDAGRLSVVPAPGDWSTLVEEVTALFQPLAAAQADR
jgi:signal transduction histidine kinase